MNNHDQLTDYQKQQIKDLTSAGWFEQGRQKRNIATGAIVKMMSEKQTLKVSIYPDDIHYFVNN